MSRPAEAGRGPDLQDSHDPHLGAWAVHSFRGCFVSERRREKGLEVRLRLKVKPLLQSRRLLLPSQAPNLKSNVKEDIGKHKCSETQSNNKKIYSSLQLIVNRGCTTILDHTFVTIRFGHVSGHVLVGVAAGDKLKEKGEGVRVFMLLPSIISAVLLPCHADARSTNILICVHG